MRESAHSQRASAQYANISAEGAPRIFRDAYSSFRDVFNYPRLSDERACVRARASLERIARSESRGGNAEVADVARAQLNVRIYANNRAATLVAWRGVAEFTAFVASSNAYLFACVHMHDATISRRGHADYENGERARARALT